jgi:phosphomannomutase
MPFIRSISGIRATTADSLPDELIERYMRALCEYLPGGSIVVGRDGRPSGEHIAQIITDTISKCGRTALILGIVPTPTVQLLVEKYGAAAGIAVTASHNPAEWNGMKFINSRGIFFNEAENQELWQIADNELFKSYNLPDGEIVAVNDPIAAHIAAIAEVPLFRNFDRLDRIRSRAYRIVVDAVNSSGSEAVPRLLEYFGCIPYKLFCDSNGIFPHTPEPLPANLSDLCKEVLRTQADFGIAVDPDADRLVLIDDKGVPIGEENTIALAAESVLSEHDMFFDKYEKCVVVNHSTTMVIEDIARKHGAVALRSAVGEINVVGKMLETNAAIGGEGSGGVIMPACHAGRDSLVGIALILNLLSRTKGSLSALAAELPHYSMLKTKQPFEGSLDSILQQVENAFPNAEIIREDGIKIIQNDGWVQIRKSNTEPIIRIISEATNIDIANNYIEIIQQIVAK